VRKIAISILLAILIVGCTTETKDHTAIFQGKVFYLDKSNIPIPVNDALVRVRNTVAQAKTDGEGSYRLVVESNVDTFNAVVEASKVGFEMGIATVTAQVGKTILVPDITLRKTSSFGENPTDTLSASGPARHITVTKQTTEHVYIKGSGLNETALVNFAVTDDNGKLVDSDHSVTVHFSILNGPGGGEYLFPESMTTQNGYVYTILNSGIIAGPVQIQAEAEVEGKTIRSIPIRLTIHGGLPDARHFSIALEKSNIAGRVHYGIIDKITAFVADKYSNPVVPGTAVYFSTNYSMVEGSDTTNTLGQATVRFVSADPLPPDPATNPFATITAYTYSDTLGQKKIVATTQVLLTDRTAPIEVTPDTFSYTDVNRPTQFSYRVHDIWGYPLVGDTRIEVSSTDGNLYGDVSVQLRDTQISGPGTTDFSFTWAPGDSLEAPEVYITITVSPPEDGNGYQSKTIRGYKR